MSATTAKPASSWIVSILTLGAVLAFWGGGVALGVVFALLLGAYLFLRQGADTDLAGRVDFLERRVADLQTAVAEMRRPRPAPAAAPTPPPTRRPEPPPAPRPAPVPAPTQPVAAARSFDWGPPKIAAADLMGAKALAFAGGVVTLLGVVFFFVLAVNRGWIGPELRVGAGGLASAIVFAAGVWLKRRYETTYSALTAVGVGIAGAYATLLAAVSLYDLLSQPVALVLAAAIAAVGVTVSLLWSSEIVAGFGLIGAMAVPATLVFQGGLEEIGTAFVAVVFAAATVVAVRQRWWKLLQLAALVSVPQAIAQVADAAAPHTGIVTLAAAFWLLYLAAGLAFQLTLGRALSAAPASFLTGSAVFGGACAAILYAQRDEGIALLVLAAVYLAATAGLFRRAREVAALLGVLGLALVAVGLADILSGPSLTYAWAAEAALLAWLGSRLRDSRFQLVSIAYLTLAVVHAFAFEASPDHLFDAFRHPAKGAPAVVLIAAAALVFAVVKRSWDDKSSRGLLRFIDPVLAQLGMHERRLDVAAYSLSALAAAYAASLGILELFQDVGAGDGIGVPFEWGQVAVTATWSAACVVATVLAVRAKSTAALALALTGLGATIVKVLAFDVPTLSDTRFGISLAIVGTAALLAGLAREVSAPSALTPEGVSALVVSLALVIAGGLVLWTDPYMLVAIGALYAALGAWALLRVTYRDLSTVLWSLGLATTAVGAVWLLSGEWLVLAYTVTAATLALLSVVVRERRLQVAALAYLALGAGCALITEAPPTDLVRERAHPGGGVPSLLVVIAATAVLAWAVGWKARYRVQALWVAGALAVYAASLAILDSAQRLSPDGVHTDFQRGQTVVSAFWGILALVSLYLGLRQSHRVLRAGGFILFAISLGKIFLFDLPSLSSAQRALSFLAVGAVLLLGGFFYQRLSAQFDEPVT